MPGLQVVPLGYLRHAPWPLHVPSRPQLATSDSGQVLADRGLRPEGTKEQVPIVAGTLQALHVSVQAESQQIPSTQKLDWQSLLHPQVCPIAFCAPPASTQLGPVGGRSPPRSAGPSVPPSVDWTLRPPPHPADITASRTDPSTATIKRSLAKRILLLMLPTQGSGT